MCEMVRLLFRPLDRCSRSYWRLYIGQTRTSSAVLFQWRGIVEPIHDQPSWDRIRPSGERGHRTVIRSQPLVKQTVVPAWHGTGGLSLQVRSVQWPGQSLDRGS